MDIPTFYVFSNDHFMDLKIYQCGVEQCQPSYSFGPSTRNHYLFHYVISGTGVLYSSNSKGEDRTYEVKENQGFMIFPKQVNTYIADKSAPWKYIWIEFDGLKAKSIIEMAGLSPDTPIYSTKSTEVLEKTLNEMVYIVEHCHSSIYDVLGHLYIFLDSLVQSNIKAKRLEKVNMKDFYIQEAISFIENHFQDNISVEEIADFCGLNRSYFGKIFKSVVGKSPQDFLLEYRMSKATELLKLTDLSIKDVGIAVGYENQFHFSRAFKNIYDISPYKWKKQNTIM
jgi:AraC-like DNA-binding protein